MKSNKIDPEIKSTIDQHTGSIGAWGPKEIYVEMGDTNFTNDLVQIMKTKGWYLIDEESDDKNLFFHYGIQEKVIEEEVPTYKELNLSGEETWTASSSQKAIIYIMIALFGFIFYKVWTNPRIMTFRYPTLYQFMVLAFYLYLIYKWLRMISWKLKINGTDITIKRLFSSTILPISQVKRIMNEKSQYWARSINIVLKNGKEISCQGINQADANELTSILKALVVSRK
jgi:hypothetical protein